MYEHTYNSCMYISHSTLSTHTLRLRDARVASREQAIYLSRPLARYKLCELVSRLDHCCHTASIFVKHTLLASRLCPPHHFNDGNQTPCFITPKCICLESGARTVRIRWCEVCH
ncbi:unnamed protein product [Sphacelaria rigidula]